MSDWMTPAKAAELDAEAAAYARLREIADGLASELCDISEVLYAMPAAAFDYVGRTIYEALWDEGERRGHCHQPEPSELDEVPAAGQRADSHETAVYRAFDAEGRLLYVGITKSPHARMRGHETTSEWWPEMQSVSFEWLPNRAAAMDLERDLIQSLRPPFNIEHHPERVR